ncbi:MAG: tetraacyldisaccharide 4'-kinase [Acidobacteria bacterium]|nr:MAG: tetraacyldisaccharide 4'-kinase [Acidobacteriota bacterium]
MDLASGIFGRLVRARDRAYANGRLGVAHLPRPVVSIGNLRVGGSGKTPTVIALGQALQQQGLRLDVLSRGYRRASSKLAIAETGDEDVTQVGDEPKLIAARLGAPVLVHPDRFRAGLEGERRFQPQLHLLDDGFQHRQLYRNFDLVLVAPGDLEDRLLPAGRLRELPRALARAHAVLWVGDEASFAAAQPQLAALTQAKLLRGEKRAQPLDEIPSRPVAFCGLARPESFWETLAELGVVPVARQTFRDHHHYSLRDLARLRARAQAAGADGFITTAKDAVNLPTPLPHLRVVEIAMHIPAIQELTAIIREACGL